MDNTFFLGNGLNYLEEGNRSWNALLDELKGTKGFDSGTLPNTMIYERIVLDNAKRKEELTLKREITDRLRDIKPSKIYELLYKSNAQNYITTNYDNGFIESVKRIEDIEVLPTKTNTEKIYSIRRAKQINNKFLWQIHGEIDKPITIMLGLDHYCGSIGKIDDYIKGAYNYENENQKYSEAKMQTKLDDNSFHGTSWIDLFFTTNIHIIGFSLDFSEIDIWWILNKRARLKQESNGKIKNKIHFYCNKMTEQKLELLKSFDVEVHINETEEEHPDFNFYEKIIKGI